MKDDGQLDEDRNGKPRIANRLKESYKDVLKEDEQYQRFSVQKLEEEKNKVDELQGKTYDF